MRKREDRPHSRAQALIHFSAISALLVCLFAFFFFSLLFARSGQGQGRTHHHEGGTTPTTVPGALCNPRRGPAGSARPRPEGSLRGRFCSSGVPLPGRRAKQQYLRKTRPGSCPGLFGKHPPPPQLTWRATGLARARSVGGGSDSTTPPPGRPAWNSFWNLPSAIGGTGGAGPLWVLLVLPGPDKELATPLGSCVWSGSNLPWNRLGVEALKPGVVLFNKHRAAS